MPLTLTLTLILGEEHVLGLDVRVAQPLRVQQRQRAAHLLHQPRRLAFGERTFVNQMVE